MIQFDSKHYSINDFREWDERKELQLSPKFQRRKVWSDKAKSYLMDTIIRGYPISKIFMRHDIDPRTKKSIREIVDGQQRVSTILNYLEDGFYISKVHNELHGGKYYSQLPITVQKDILQHQISVDVLLGAEDVQVLDIFARLNTYTVKLNKQELRNAKYFGHFKQLVYSLGFEYAEFLQTNKVLTQKDVARMAEAELASELVIFIIDGAQDRKKIDEYYRTYDETLPAKKSIATKFRKAIDAISEIMKGLLPDSAFSQRPLFYSLFGVIHELNEASILTEKKHPKIFSVLQNLEQILEMPPEELSSRDIPFYEASTKHVTDLKNRQLRHRFIKNAILQTLK